MNLFCQDKIVVADAFYAVGNEVDHHFVPNVEPLRMVVHGLGDQSDAGHVTKGRHEILARIFLVQFAVDDFQPGNLERRACISASDSFFAGMARPSKGSLIGSHIMSRTTTIGNFGARLPGRVVGVE